MPSTAPWQRIVRVIAHATIPASIACITMSTGLSTAVAAPSYRPPPRPPAPISRPATVSRPAVSPFKGPLKLAPPSQAARVRAMTGPLRVSPSRNSILFEGRVYRGLGIGTLRGISKDGKSAIYERVPGQGSVHPRVQTYRIGPSNHASTGGSVVIRPEDLSGRPVNPDVSVRQGSMAKDHPNRHIRARADDLDRAFGVATPARTSDQFNFNAESGG